MSTTLRTRVEDDRALFFKTQLDLKPVYYRRTAINWYDRHIWPVYCRILAADQRQHLKHQCQFTTESPYSKMYEGVSGQFTADLPSHSGVALGMSVDLLQGTTTW